MKAIRILAAAALIVAVLSGCNGTVKPAEKTNVENKNEEKTEVNQEQEKEPGKTYEFSKESYPKVDGSTATIPLSEGIAAKLLKMDKTQIKSFIKHNTTHNAYVNLVERNADIIFVTEPSDEELKLAKEKGIELEVVPVVKDAFVFLVNTKNPVDSLKLKEIQDIYQGKIRNWRAVGGNDLEIIAYQRPKNAGSQTSMENIVMKGLPMAEAPKELKPEAMDGLIERVAGYDNSERALGYSVFYYANTMYTKDTIKLIGVNGIKPDKTTIMSGDYPLTSAYYAVLRKDEPKSSSARLLLEWLLTDQGQRAAEDCGYIPVK